MTSPISKWGFALLLSAGCQGNVTGTEPGTMQAGGPDQNASGSGPGPTQQDLPRPAVGTFAGPIVSTPSATTRFSRLTHRQWENTVRDVLKLSAPSGYSSEFVAEPLRSTFDTNSAVLSVSSDTFQDYQHAAEKLADTTLKGEVRTRLGADATTFIKNLGKRAFRRPLTDAEVTTIKTLFDKGKALIGSGDDLGDGAALVAEYLFQSPHFLYREELSTGPAGTKAPLNPYEVASRLSYALTASMPDDALLAAADGAMLASREQVVAQVKRLLATSGASESLLDFHDQLLMMRDYDNIAKRDSFPGFGAGAPEDLKQEAKHFIHDVVFAQDLGFHTLMTAPYTFANQRIRGLYGLDNQAPAGAAATDFSKLVLDPTQRAGLLTQVGFLAANGEQDTPNIIIRGVHIARRIMCAALPPPPKNVPPLPAIAPNSTNRQRVEMATKDSPCNGCHSTIINPLGVALEHLDGVGKFRTVDNGQPVDSTTSYAIDGQPTPIAGAVELANAIAGSEQANGCYAQNLAEYLYGRVVSRDTDNQLVQQGGWLSHDKESLQNLVVNLLATDAFLTRLQ